MTSPPSSILVLGAGEIGTCILSALNSHPHQSNHMKISLLLRSSSINTSEPSKKEQLASFTDLGITLVAGDIANDSPSHLACIFRNYDCIIGASGMYAPSGTQLKLCHAVLDARVPLYIPWHYGVDYDVIGRGSAQNLFTEQIDVRDALRGQQETRWVIVSTGMFMSFLFEEFWGVVQRDGAGKVKGVNALGGWETRVTVTDVKDIARVIAEVAFVMPETRGIVYAAGDTLSYAEFADLVEEIVRRKIERNVWTLDYLRGDLEKAPDDSLRKYRIVFGEGRGVAWDKEDSINVRQGINCMDAREYAKNILS
ncbi:MAG: hypothetical protein M1820_002798 [Bogoriella megaspora]|nr:MAG: hypothetical protein M1820_002798 [Bogoriella megaspora]